MTDKEDKKKYYHTDIETGYTFEVSKEFHDRMQSLWNRCRPKIDSDLVGKMIITSTAGEENNFTKELFYKSKK